MPRNSEGEAVSKPKSKICACCGRRKPLEKFGKNPRMALGVKSYCRVCSADKQREWNRLRRADEVLA